MAMESQHHLKYKGRLQYGLFLKGIGLSMEEAIRFLEFFSDKKWSGFSKSESSIKGRREKSPEEEKSPKPPKGANSGSDSLPQA